MPATENITKVEIRYVPDAQIAKVYFPAQVGDRKGFLPIDDLVITDMPGFQGSRRAVDHPVNLDTIFNAYQDIDGTEDERCAQLKVRSMTAGDAIVIDNVGYYVTSKDFAPSGFVTIVDDEVVPVPFDT